MTASLYERLGGADAVKAIAHEIIENHLRNPIVGTRFRNADVPRLKEMARQFLSMGTGGPDTYTGKDIRASHAGMNISEQEFVAVLDDAMAALETLRVAPTEKAEVLAALYSLKGEVVRL